MLMQPCTHRLDGPGHMRKMTIMHALAVQWDFDRREQLSTYVLGGGVFAVLCWRLRYEVML